MADSAELTSRTIGDIDLTGSAPIFAVDLDRQSAIADPPVAAGDVGAIAARLARVERLLEADLAALGPSVVTASIEEITARLGSLHADVEAAGARWERAEERLGGQLAVRVEGRLDRLTRLVEAATEPEPEGTLTPTDVALQGVAARLDALTTEVARLAAILDRVEQTG